MLSTTGIRMPGCLNECRALWPSTPGWSRSNKNSHVIFKELAMRPHIIPDLQTVCPTREITAVPREFEGVSTFALRRT